MSQKYCSVMYEYKKNKNLKEEDVQILQKWLEKEAHLPKLDELTIIAFLNTCRCNIEQTKLRIDNYYTIKAHWPEFTKNRNIFSKHLQQILNIMLVTILPKRTKDNYFITYTKLLDSNHELFNQNDCIKLFDMAIFLWLKFYGISEGVVLIMDMEKYTRSHYFIHPSVARKIVGLQKNAPFILKAVHMINVSRISDILFNTLKPLMPKELADKIHLHSKLDTLSEFVPKEVLPDDYNGKAGTIQDLHENFVKLMEENVDYFVKGEKYVVDEAKRVGKSKNLDELFGRDGTFKKLNID